MAGHLPKELAGKVDKRLGVIAAQPNLKKGLDAAKRLAAEFEADPGRVTTTTPSDSLSATTPLPVGWL